MIVVIHPCEVTRIINGNTVPGETPGAEASNPGGWPAHPQRTPSLGKFDAIRKNDWLVTAMEVVPGRRGGTAR